MWCGGEKGEPSKGLLRAVDVNDLIQAREYSTVLHRFLGISKGFAVACRRRRLSGPCANAAH